MKKRILLNTIILFTLTIYGQVGINTPNPLGIFHIDGKKDNPLIGTPNTITQQNDVIITENGDLAIGIIIPTNKLTINNEGKTDTGIQLSTGASHGNILISDQEGNATWAAASNPITILNTLPGQISVYGTRHSWEFYNQFTEYYDEIKQIFGNEFGWDNINKLYKIPKNGIYRITLNIVCGTSEAKQNWRIAVVKNNYTPSTGEQHFSMNTMPFVSPIPDKKESQNSTITGIVMLNKNDFLQIKTANYGSGDGTWHGAPVTTPTIIVGGPQETIWTIEML
ncbi:hypothetical protein [Myroides sp. C4067]|uniref:hypothetical protein n=1 Tax=Myroides sp. C4067 TaxID=3136765 RepID=UPI0031013901